MNKSLQQGSAFLELFGVEPPYTDEECQKMTEAFQGCLPDNVNSLSDIQAIDKGFRGELGITVALQEVANEIKADRLKRQG